MQEELQEFYREQYKKISYSGAGLKFSNYFHKALEKNYDETITFDKVLELGAGDCQHASFVRHKYKIYLQTDILEYKVFLTDKENVRFEIQDAQSLNYPDNEFNRVISTCLLHHLETPDRALKEWRRVSKDGGKIDILLPSDPGILYRIARKLASEWKVKKILNSTDFSISKYRYIHAIDHRNHVDSLEKMIKHIFIKDEIIFKRFPAFIPFWNFNLFSIINITVIK